MLDIFAITQAPSLGQAVDVGIDGKGGGGRGLGAMTTEAVLCPTPGRASSSTKVPGTWPLWCVIRIWDS